ncbi:MAG: redoxin domain-containing protein [Bacteroidales bacterium]|nr:redoxin domain-containing protein [Bacteroidales bacterium]
MKKLAVIIFSVILCVLDAAAQVDSARMALLDARMEEYFALLEQEPVTVKIEECDVLIEASQDPAVRQAIALKVYDHYRHSALMGDEAVAIHVTDTWFIPGKVAMGSDSDLFEARMFADFNRLSLIGMPAPEAELTDPLGESVFIGEAAVRQVRQTSVYYFYDIDCAKCKLETATLRSLLNDKDYPVAVYAVYVGTDEDGWKRWMKNSFVLDTEETEVFHLWDPDSSADLQFKYGIIQTPRMFLVDQEGTIIGRGLDTGSLEQMLDVLLDDGEYDYGSEASKALFDKLFSTYGGSVSASDVADVASLLKGRTLDLGDTLGFKHLEGDLLYYIAGKREEGFREGAASVIDGYILTRPDVWNTDEDTLMVVGMAEMLDGLLKKAPVGSKIPRMCIKGWNRFRQKGGYMFFHAEGCQICEAEMALADSLGLDYFAVNMDALEEKSPKKARKLLDAFDLSGLPFVMKVSEGGIVERRYLSLTEQLLFFEEKE